MKLREDAQKIIDAAIRAALPDTAVRKALAELPETRGRLVLIAAGKAAWAMARTACDVLGSRVDCGAVVTKTGHAQGPIAPLIVMEGGHPVPDARSFAATETAIGCVRGLSKDDTVLFLLSGGGSALFEKPRIPGEELAEITRQLLAGGADIVEMNIVRKRLSAVKGGRFAQLCAPAKVFQVVLSDIIGDPLDMIASGPAVPDGSTCAQALAIAEKYALTLSDAARACLNEETPKALDNVETRVTGSVRQLCAAAEATARELGYRPMVLTSSMDCEARDAGAFIAAVAREHAADGPAAYIAGGETVVHVTGHGLGGRNQELALAAAKGLAGLDGALLFSIGSDGTDGPTDAAGGWVTGETRAVLNEKGVDIDRVLADNDAYHALQKCGGLIITGATGTNVNDLTVLLLDGMKR